MVSLLVAVVMAGSLASLWKENGGVVNRLNASDQKRMTDDSAELAGEIVDQDDAVKSEYDRLKALAVSIQ